MFSGFGVHSLPCSSITACVIRLGEDFRNCLRVQQRQIGHSKSPAFASSMKPSSSSKNTSLHKGRSYLNLEALAFPLRLRCSKLCPSLFCCLRNLRSRSRRHHPFPYGV